MFDRGGGLDKVAEAEVEEAAAEPGAVDADGVVGRRGQVLFLDEVRGGDGRDVLQPDVIVEVGGLLQDIREEDDAALFATECVFRAVFGDGIGQAA